MGAVTDAIGGASEWVGDAFTGGDGDKHQQVPYQRGEQVWGRPIIEKDKNGKDVVVGYDETGIFDPVDTVNYDMESGRVMAGDPRTHQMNQQADKALGMLGETAQGKDLVATREAGLARDQLRKDALGMAMSAPGSAAARRGAQMALSKGSANIGAQGALAAAKERLGAQQAYGQLGAGLAGQAQQYELGKNKNLQGWAGMEQAEMQADRNARMEQAKMKANMHTSQYASDRGASAAQYGKDRDANAAMFGNITRGIGAAIMGGSDERAKKNVEPASSKIEQLLDELSPVQFEYKDEVEGKPGFPPGTHIGVMAQDMEKSPVGNKSVAENEDGVKMLDLGKVAATSLAAAASLHDRIKALEARDERGRSELASLSKTQPGGADMVDRPVVSGLLSDVLTDPRQSYAAAAGALQPSPQMMYGSDQRGPVAGPEGLAGQHLDRGLQRQEGELTDGMNGILDQLMYDQKRRGR